MKFVTKSQLQDVVEYMGENIHVPQLVQHFDRDNIYSTDERVVGCWIDGKPLYKKTINFGAGPNNTTKQFTHGISIDSVVDAWGIGVSGVNRSPIPYISKDLSIIAALNVRTTTIDISTNVDLSSYTIYVTLYYTKTTDAVNSFNLADENDYSTTEKIIGKWVDGSTLYQKTVEVGTLTNAVSTEATKTTVHGISNLGKVVSASGHWYLTANPSTGGIIPYSDKNYYISALAQGGNNVAVNYKGDWSTATVYVTIQYTKTTD